MFKKTIFTITFIFLFSVPAWAVKYYFNNEYYPTVSNTAHIQDIWMDGYITARSDWMYIYVQYGAHHAGSSMLGWQDMHGFTGTLVYTNINYDDSCRFTDYYENGNRTLTEINCRPRTDKRVFLTRSPSFWAP